MVGQSENDDIVKMTEFGNSFAVKGVVKMIHYYTINGHFFVLVREAGIIDSIQAPWAL